MPEIDTSAIEYESGESTEILVPKNVKEAIAEVDIEEALYGKNQTARGHPALKGRGMLRAARCCSPEFRNHPVFVDLKPLT